MSAVESNGQVITPADGGPNGHGHFAGWCVGFLIGTLIVAHGSSAQEANGSATTADTLSVEDCVALARTHAPDVLAASAMRSSARADSIATGFNRRPTFSLLGGATVAPHGFYDPTVTDLGTYQLKLGAEWPLLDAGARSIERSRAALEASGATAELASASREASRRAAEVALDQLRQQENERSQTEALTWLDRLSEVLESAVRAGGRGRADAARVTLERSTVAAALLQTRQARAALERELLELTGRGEARIVVREPAEQPGEVPAPDDSTRLMARVALRPEVRQAEVEEARQRVAVLEVRRRKQLRVGLSADAGLAGADLTTTVPEDLRASNPDATLADRLRRDLGASVSVDFKRPLADPAQASALSARREALRAATLRREAALARARRDVFDLLDRWRLAGQRRDLARTSAVRADENLLRMRSLYSGGGAGLLELLDARRQLDEARERLADSQLEARQAHYEAEIP